MTNTAEQLQELSDFEINKRVAPLVDIVIERLSDEYVYISDEDDDMYYKAFDPCNNWADAGPIIVENQIAVIPPVSNGTNGWKAERFYPENCGKLIDAIDKNPLRAAMIVFLMMKEQAND